MKGLSIRQPWTYAIFWLCKDIENRGWATDVRGRVAIHASGQCLKSDYEDARVAILSITGSVLVPPREQLELGVILGTVEIVDCVTRSDSRWFVGKYGFVMRDPIMAVPPIPFKAMLGFWDVPEDIAKKLS
jgi:hypothetical protein